jgi:hypothetical protein
MFLKVFKQKSNQKFINNILLHRKAEVSDNKTKTIGVLFNEDEFDNNEHFSEFLKDLNIQSRNQRFLMYSTKKNESQSSWQNRYTSKDFGWRGKLKNSDLQNFTDSEFDVLICYFLADEIELNQIAAMSMSSFKVGISNNDDRLYDLIINVNPSNFEAFKRELKKYLTLLNKL